MENRPALLDVLNRILAAEYGVLWLLPRHLPQVHDEELKRQLRLIGDVELEHAEKSAAMIFALGQEPVNNYPNLHAGRDLREVLQIHLEGERQAIALYQEAMDLASDGDMRRQLEILRGEEEGHQRLIARALAQLDK